MTSCEVELGDGEGDGAEIRQTGLVQGSGDTALDWDLEKGKGMDPKETDQQKTSRERAWRKRQVSGAMLGQGEAGPETLCRWDSPASQPGSPRGSTQNDYGHTEIKGT